MRSSGSRVRASGRRSGCVAASLIVLAACGDNTSAKGRLAPARYIWDDGTEQIDHHMLYDRTLESLCTPTRFADDKTYCMPSAEDGFYIDNQCVTAVARVPSGQTPKAFVATTFGLAGALAVSRIYRAGALIDVPQQRWERRNNLCVTLPLDDGFDYYATGPQIMDLAQVHLPTDHYDAWNVDWIVGDGVSMPWRVRDPIYGECEVVARPTSTTTWCHPSSAVTIDYYQDDQCSIPFAVAPTKPGVGYVGDLQCASYSDLTSEALSNKLYRSLDGACADTNIPGPTRGYAVGPTVTLPILNRERSGRGRVKTITLAPLPLTDDMMFDNGLLEDCRRDEQGRCVPANPATVETWFTDPQCGQPIDVAMVRTSCLPDSSYARKGDAYVHVGDVYKDQLYQLSTGDTCQIYNPPVPFVAHSLGAVVSDSLLARATLMIE